MKGIIFILLIGFALSYCGDGKIDSDEVCDDGNDEPKDGCDCYSIDNAYFDCKAIDNKTFCSK